jgi:hypothetical protein
MIRVRAEDVHKVKNILSEVGIRLGLITHMPCEHPFSYHLLPFTRYTSTH